ncbi:hypothetical protein CDAR_239271 [Caerostris darwini]|uniref:Uncharacterized protein n=1 Tax=Caerostris darwini TaxID=1538125 RepID=A0AAV4SSN1_9ARAC|nr:hypothetical protein CDAR_239271 [Caerostris darwini]
MTFVRKEKKRLFNSCSARERVSQSSVGVPGKVPLWSGRHLELKYPSIFRDKREKKKDVSHPRKTGREEAANRGKKSEKPNPLIFLNR